LQEASLIGSVGFRPQWTTVAKKGRKVKNVLRSNSWCLRFLKGGTGGGNALEEKET